MNEKKEKEITEEVATTKPLENSTANNTDLEIKKVIEKIDLLSQNDNPHHRLLPRPLFYLFCYALSRYPQLYYALSRYLGAKNIKRV